MADLDAIRLSDRQVREAEREARRSDPRRHRTVRARRGRQEKIVEAVRTAVERATEG
jgi:hypothetical protein